MSRFASARSIRAEYSISPQTLRRWADAGTLPCLWTPGGGKRLYDIKALRRILGDNPPLITASERSGIIYGRVSSAHQKEDLQRQVDELKEAYPDYEVVQDIGSGINFRRRGFKALLERVYRGMVGEVVVMHVDRLCRFGIDLLRHMFSHFGVRLVVHGKDKAESDSSELADDLLAVTTVFVARNNGQRSASNKRRRIESQKNSGVSIQIPEGDVASLVRDEPLHV